MIKKVSVVLLMLLSSVLACIAQNNSIGILFQPKHTEIVFSDDNERYNVGATIEFGLVYTHQLFNKLGLDTRFLYSKFKYLREMDSYGTYVGNVFQPASFYYYYEYISLPLSLRYQLFEKGKIQIGIRCGMSVDKYISHKNDFRWEINEVKLEIGDYNFSGIISVPVSYALNDKFSLVAEPQFNHVLFHNHHSEKSNPTLMGIGVNIGAAFHF